MKAGISVVLTSLIVAGVTAGQTRPSVILTQPTEAFAEEREPDEIETDRDSFTPSVRTVERGRLITESAYTYFDFRKRPERHSFPELLFRYGATERLELRLGWNSEIGEERESNLNVGTKLQITNAGGDKTITGQGTCVWIREGGPWRFITWHSTPVAAQ